MLKAVGEKERVWEEKGLGHRMKYCGVEGGAGCRSYKLIHTIFSVGKEAKLGKAPGILDTQACFLGRRREPIFIQYLFIW